MMFLNWVNLFIMKKTCKIKTKFYQNSLLTDWEFSFIIRLFRKDKMISFNQISSLQNLFQKQTDFTLQEVKFWSLCSDKGYQFVLDNPNTIKRNFMLWQSFENPKLRLSKAHKQFIKDFSHELDATWVSLDTWIGFIKREVDFKNTPINPEVEEMINDEFPL